MNFPNTSRRKPGKRAAGSALDLKVASYAASAASLGLVASEAGAVIVSNTTPQPFGINQEVDIDWNSDGQIDWQIDHDRVNLNGTDLDYLQIDKNDISSAADPFPIDPFVVFETNGTNPNADHGFVTDALPGEQGYYPKALIAGTEIGPLSTGWGFDESDNHQAGGTTIRANRLIDEDAGQIDSNAFIPVTTPSGTPGWVGLNGEVRYLGLRIDLNDANAAGSFNYGWIGVRIDNEGDATGVVTGWGYQTEPDVSILAGETAPGTPGDFNGDGTVDAADYTIWRDNLGLMGGATPSQGDANGDGNVTSDDYVLWKSNFGDSGNGAFVGANATAAVPEPSTFLLGAFAGIALVGSFFYRRIVGR